MCHPIKPARRLAAVINRTSNHDQEPEEEDKHPETQPTPYQNCKQPEPETRNLSRTTNNVCSTETSDQGTNYETESEPEVELV